MKQGANAASPLLFPETVYNAPASHLAAMLGVDGATYTLVGDGTVGLQALEFGAQLIATGDADDVLVVAAEELDWILFEAHRAWRLIAQGGDGVLEKWTGSCAPLSEGAAAVLLSRDPGIARVSFADGRTHFSKVDATVMVEQALADIEQFGTPDVIVSRADGSWAGAGVAFPLIRRFPDLWPAALKPNLSIGECLGAGALLQVVLALDELQRTGAQRALVAALGWNQQAAVAMIERARS